MRFPRSLLLLMILWCIVIGTVTASAERVPFKSVEATFAEDRSQLSTVIDGKDTGHTGWSVFPKVNEKNSLWVTAKAPVQAQAFDVTLCFLSGVPLRYCARFALSYTTDENPSLSSRWEKVVPERFTAIGPTLRFTEQGRFQAGNAGSMIGDAIFQIRFQAPPQPVTGFRIEVFPYRANSSDDFRVAWNEYRDFRLTEFRVEATRTQTTNVALGCSVRASDQLWADTPASVLTDGLPGSFTHPAQADLGRDFYFEVDLGVIREIDHISLRGRADGYGLDRMSRLLVRLFSEAVDGTKPPIWETMDRPDGSYPAAGEVDILRPDPETGRVRGRYIRISSDSQVALSPQLAEVEVYETITPKLLSIEADGHSFVDEKPLEVPAGTRVLRFAFSSPAADMIDRALLRWRVNKTQEWQYTTDSVAELVGPKPGSYALEAQLRHTDGEWDQSALIIPFTIDAYFWQTPFFAWGAFAGGVGILLAGTRTVVRRRDARKLAALEYHSALAEERSRIARDMHDAVGARLSQIALMQDLLVRQHAVSETAERSLLELARNTREAVDALDQVVWAVNPLHDSLQGVVEYLSQTASSYLAPLNIGCRLEVPFDWPDIEVRAQIRHQLILAFREALQNVAKHSGADTVILTISYQNGWLHVSLEDNGKGLPKDVSGFGKEGLNNMKSRLQTIGGTCEFRTRPEGGTAVEMSAPVAHP